MNVETGKLKNEESFHFQKDSSMFDQFRRICGIFRENASLWIHFLHFTFGNSFVFNIGGIQRTSVLRSTIPGISQGLTLEMNIQKQEFLDTTAGAGTVFGRTDPAKDDKRCREGDKFTRKNLCTEILNTSYSMTTEAGGQLKFSDEDFGSKNNLRLHVFYQELEREVIKEVMSYTMDAFILGVGGQLGLWVGVSVLPLVEFLELITTLSRFAFKIY
ncbi:hypothetical protein pdam_00000880 [Pocillopora damicornis]|uniref:Uncharacterized protein n=1 Tax=Pocillopora damicornis TaxID=46731 RepID=A0A3M6TV43_POCDA|nr:hypothetical protein pdam_00000880 [Pocillopora damicornis]